MHYLRMVRDYQGACTMCTLVRMFGLGHFGTCLYWVCENMLIFSQDDLKRPKLENICRSCLQFMMLLDISRSFVHFFHLKSNVLSEKTERS